MGVEFKYPWRLIDKRGNVVADGMSPYADNAGDWVLQDDNTWLNYETGERASGNIGFLDKDGNLVEDDEQHNLSKSGKGGDSRAFGEIRSNLGSGVSPAFEQAVHTDRPKIENPNEPTPENPSPSDNGGSGGSLIGEISKQNKILQNLAAKSFQIFLSFSKNIVQNKYIFCQFLLYQFCVLAINFEEKIK